MSLVHEFEVEGPLGMVDATWQYNGGNIEVRYGERMQLAKAMEFDAANEITARSIVRGWISDDMRGS